MRDFTYFSNFEEGEKEPFVGPVMEFLQSHDTTSNTHPASGKNKRAPG